MFACLVFALFLPDLWVFADRPHNNDLDVILTIVLFLFVMELVIQSIGLMHTYWGSFFFWMDLLGAVSLFLDLSYVPLFEIFVSSNSNFANNVVIMRAARVAK